MPSKSNNSKKTNRHPNDKEDKQLFGKNIEHSQQRGSQPSAKRLDAEKGGTVRRPAGSHRVHYLNDEFDEYEEGLLDEEVGEEEEEEGEERSSSFSIPKKSISPKNQSSELETGKKIENSEKRRSINGDKTSSKVQSKRSPPSK